MKIIIHRNRKLASGGEGVGKEGVALAFDSVSLTQMKYSQDSEYCRR